MPLSTLPKTITLKITKDQLATIKKGKLASNDVRRCPIKKALTRLGYSSRVMGHKSVVVSENHDAATYVHSKRLIRFIDNFDSRKPLSPGNFTLKRQK